VAPDAERKDQGIEGVLREIFPIESYDKSLRWSTPLRAGQAAVQPDECRSCG
jgi:DNA-directed RNA polymerase subunit beta